MKYGAGGHNLQEAYPLLVGLEQLPDLRIVDDEVIGTLIAEVGTAVWCSGVWCSGSGSGIGSGVVAV